jgi:hypothetical protein
MILNLASPALTLASVIGTALVATSTSREIVASVNFAKLARTQPILPPKDLTAAHLQTKGRNVLSTNRSRFKMQVMRMLVSLAVVRTSIAWRILRPLLVDAASNSSKTSARILQPNLTVGLQVFRVLIPMAL